MYICTRYQEILKMSRDGQPNIRTFFATSSSKTHFCAFIGWTKLKIWLESETMQGERGTFANKSLEWMWIPPATAPSIGKQGHANLSNMYTAGAGGCGSVNPLLEHSGHHRIINRKSQVGKQPENTLDFEWQIWWAQNLQFDNHQIAVVCCRRSGMEANQLNKPLALQPPVEKKKKTFHLFVFSFPLPREMIKRANPLDKFPFSSASLSAARRDKTWSLLFASSALS